MAAFPATGGRAPARGFIEAVRHCFTHYVTFSGPRRGILIPLLGWIFVLIILVSPPEPRRNQFDRP